MGDDGTPVLPISYNGTTYLPVRAMGYLLGLGIGWDHATQTVLITRSAAPGWYLTRWEYVILSQDFSLVGALKGSVIGKTGSTWDTHKGTGEKNDFTYAHTRTDDSGAVFNDGKTVTLGKVVTKWTDPPAYFSGTDRPVITIDRVVEATWGIGTMNIHFDNDTINPGGGTSSYLSFVTPEGKSIVQAYQGTLQMEKALKGTAGAKKAIILYLDGYGFKYYYE